MIYFFSDDHFGMHCGKVIYDHLPQDLKGKCAFFEDDFSVLEKGEWVADCELLVLHMIGTTCGLPHPGPDAERAVKRYVESGRPLLLLHGSSAAFWQWDWWRALPGRRWVRGGDPDNVPTSVHPVGVCRVEVAKVRHPLAAKLQPFTLEEDEIYIRLEETAPTLTLMETTISEGTFPQCVETFSKYGNRIVSFIPGHREVNTSNPALNADIAILINDLLEVKNG